MKLFFYFTFLMCFLMACSSSTAEEPKTESSTTAPVSTFVSNTSGDFVSADPEGPADFTVQVQGINAGTSFLIGMFAEQQFKMDSAVVASNGSMRFQNADGYNKGFYLVLLPNRQTVQVLLNDDQEFTLRTNLADVVGSAVVEGNKDTELLYEALKFETAQQGDLTRVSNAIRASGNDEAKVKELLAEQDQLVNARKTFLNNLFEENPNTLFTKFKLGGQNPDLIDVKGPDGNLDQQKQVFYFRRDFWKTVDFSDNRLMHTPIIYNKLQRYMLEFIPQTPDSVIRNTDMLMAQVPVGSEFYKFFINWIAVKYEPGKSTVMDAEAVYVHMVQNYFTQEKARAFMDSLSIYGLQLRASEMANSLIGQKGPNITVPDINGNNKNLYDMKADYIVVFMYNPECDHCIEETPILAREVQRLKNSMDIDVYAIAIDTDKEQWGAFIQKNNIGNWTNVYDETNRSIYKTYYVDNTPELYLLNKDRVIIAKNLKPQQVEEAIRRDM